MKKVKVKKAVVFKNVTRLEGDVIEVPDEFYQSYGERYLELVKQEENNEDEQEEQEEKLNEKKIKEMNRGELKKELDEREVDYDGRSKNYDLRKTLLNSLNN